MMNANPKLFYLEDDQLIFSSWEKILRLEGFEITGAANVKEAINLIDAAIQNKVKYDKFLLDIIISPWAPFNSKDTLNGFITGLKVADYIRQFYFKIFGETTILFVTAALGVGGQIAKLVNDYVNQNDYCELIPKPINEALFMKKIND